MTKRKVAPGANGDNTPSKHRGLTPAWRAGQSGNSKGRPRGARSKIGEAVLEDFLDAWNEYGVQAFRKCATERPDKFCTIAVNLLPKEVVVAALVDVKSSGVGYFSDTNSIADVLEMVAKEAGHEAAITLAAMFGLEAPDDLTGKMTLLPPTPNKP
jgi:hypothetical protein